MDANSYHVAIRSFMAFLCYLTYPIFLLAKAVGVLLGTLLFPLVHMGQALLYVSLAPFRFLAKFEPLYLFLGWAVLIGGATGLLLYTAWHWTTGEILQSPKSYAMLAKKSRKFPRHLDTQSGSYLDKRSHKTTGSRPLRNQFGSKYIGESKLSDWAKSTDFPSGKRTALMSTTILEEEDDNNDFED